MSINSENLLKNSTAHSEIFGGICQIFSIFYMGTQMSPVISDINGPKFSNFLQDVGEFVTLLKQPLALQYSSPYQNASVSNEGMSANLVLKLVAVAPSLVLSEKEGQLHGIQSNAYNLLKNSHKNWSHRC